MQTLLLAGGLIAACILVAVLYVIISGGKEKQSAFIQLFQSEAQSQGSLSPIPNSQTTMAAAGYTPNLGEPPFSQTGYIPKPEPNGTCTKGTLKMRQRPSVVPSECPPGEEKIGMLCYVKCPDSMQASQAFPNQCERCKDFSQTCDYLNMIYQNRQVSGPAVNCPAGYDRYAGLCFEACAPNEVPNGNFCLTCV